MNPFKTASSIATPLDRTNVDTDQIIPKQFLKSTERTGFGKISFTGGDMIQRGEPVKDFILNNPAYDGSQVLVAGENFGCGSSREHAAWAILDRGFSVVAAPLLLTFSIIIVLKNGILPVRLEEKSIATILKAGRTMMQVDLESQTVQIDADGEKTSVHFEIDAYHKKILLEGLDEISITMQNEDKITAYEQSGKIRPIENFI